MLYISFLNLYEKEDQCGVDIADNGLILHHFGVDTWKSP